MAHARSLILALCAAGALAACDRSAGLDRLAAGERGRVVEVRSGDVLVLDSGLIVRLVGLAAPRLDQPGGAQARAALQGLAGGRSVSLFYGGVRRDAYGRALAQVRLTEGRRWLQDTLLREGLARVWTFADNRALASVMLNDEAVARSRSLGLWALQDDRVLLPGEVGPATHGFQIVEGRVVAVSEARSGTYLDFSPDPGGFAAVIPERALPSLRAGGFSPTLMRNRLIRVRGVIDWSGVMTVDHPEQIESLREP